MSKRDYKSYSILDDEINSMGQDETVQTEEHINVSEYPQQECNPVYEKNDLVSDTIEASHIESVQLQEEKSDNLKKVQDHLQSEDFNNHNGEENKEELLRQQINDKTQKLSLQSNKDMDNIGFNDTKNNNLLIKQNTLKEDTSFEKYKSDHPLKKRSGFVKWSLRLLKLTIFIMLSPLFAVILAGVITVVAVVAAAIIACIATGVGILGGICFISSQVSASIVALGFSVAIACLSLGGIISILSIMATKGLIGLFSKWRARKKVKATGGQ